MSFCTHPTCIGYREELIKLKDKFLSDSYSLAVLQLTDSADNQFPSQISVCQEEHQCFPTSPTQRDKNQNGREVQVEEVKVQPWLSLRSTSLSVLAVPMELSCYPDKREGPQTRQQPDNQVCSWLLYFCGYQFDAISNRITWATIWGWATATTLTIKRCRKQLELTKTLFYGLVKWTVKLWIKSCTNWQFEQ